METEAIDRLAKAIGGTGLVAEGGSREVARAALLAMLTPTEEMISAACGPMRPLRPHSDGPLFRDSNRALGLAHAKDEYGFDANEAVAQVIWRAMLLGALGLPVDVFDVTEVYTGDDFDPKKLPTGLPVSP